MKLRKTQMALSTSMLLLALAGCGGSSSSGSATTPPDTTPVSMLDAFYSAVASLVGSSPDTTEPQSVDTVTVTTPDNTEPVAPI
ncbi:hypothetical protein GCM10011396_48690 [Undibacterium terreum]|uniref:Uncharacterized protein n=2 Tax=Undibacterium terreum TaxID=1224302 RepID=A0A916XQ96_9BURK|nr:hypothetical protein GCM10011396_48690 [Undibacterium terreum]